MYKNYPIIVSLFISMMLCGCGNSQNQSASIEKSIPAKISEATSVAEACNLLNGTTWHYTENLSTSEIGCWLKVSFNNGQYVSYYAMPSDGKWTEGGRGEYEISEGRYSNTGEKYIAVNWKGKAKQEWLDYDAEFALTLDNFQLNVGSEQMDAIAHLNNINKYGFGGAAFRRTKYSATGVMDFGDYNWK